MDRLFPVTRMNVTDDVWRKWAADICDDVKPIYDTTYPDETAVIADVVAQVRTIADDGIKVGPRGGHPGNAGVDGRLVVLRCAMNKVPRTAGMVAFKHACKIAAEGSDERYVTMLIARLNEAG